MEWTVTKIQKVTRWFNVLIRYHVTTKDSQWYDEPGILFLDYPVFAISMSGSFEGGTDLYFNYEEQEQFIEDGLRSE